MMLLTKCLKILLYQTVFNEIFNSTLFDWNRAFLNKSEICPWGSWTQLSIIYSATVGFTGTNKRAAIDAIRNAISDVESTNGICDLQSKVNQ